VTDLIQSFPVLVFALAVVAALGHGVVGAVVVIAILDVPLYTRLIRSEVVRIRTSSYITAAIAAGNSTARLLRVHVLPNAVPAILPQIAIRFAWAIGVVAALAFVGVGVQVPTPEWGSMIRIGSSGVISGQWWPSVFPGLAIAVLIIGLNMLADALQEYWNPRRRRDV
jgi:peptide/nickel transport system permease protein